MHFIFITLVSLTDRFDSIWRLLAYADGSFMLFSDLPYRAGPQRGHQRARPWPLMGSEEPPWPLLRFEGQVTTTSQQIALAGAQYFASACGATVQWRKITSPAHGQSYHGTPYSAQHEY